MPALAYLPSKLWLIGLGHLGQAYLWGLSMLPYARPEEVELVLQDIDAVTASTLSTSILSGGSMLGEKKTRGSASNGARSSPDSTPASRQSSRICEPLITTKQAITQYRMTDKEDSAENRVHAAKLEERDGHHLP